MNRSTGHIIRIIGMLIEMVGVWGVYQTRNGNASWVITLSGGTSIPAAWVCVFVGLLIWLAGMFIVYSSKHPSRGRPYSKDD